MVNNRRAADQIREINLREPDLSTGNKIRLCVKAKKRPLCAEITSHVW
ncbi:hypothetical protein GGE65_007241 [Skermanella aerolata]